MSGRRVRRVLATVAVIVVAIALPLTWSRRTTTETPAAGTSIPVPTTHRPVPTVSYAGRVGLSSHVFWFPRSKTESELRAVAGGGVRWVREDLDWGALEPSRGHRDWSKADNLMRAASLAGVNVLGILDYSARWAMSGPDGKGHYPPKSAADYADFARAVADRYRPGGGFWDHSPDLTPVAMALEIWNEPFAYWSWAPDPDPAAYAALARAAAGAIRSADPKIKILISGDVLQFRRDHATLDWLDKVLTVDPGLGALIDAYSVHPYPYTRSKSPTDDSGEARSNFDRVPETHAIAVAHGAEHPIWITEIGWTTATRTAEGVTEAKQATFVHDAIERAFTEWAFVDKVFVYTWDDSNGVATDVEGNFGVRRANGSAKPAWQAVKDAATRWRT